LSRRSGRRERIEAYVLILPLFLGLALYIVYPVIMNFFYAFTRWNGFSSPVFVGWRNFVSLAGDYKFWQSIRNIFLLFLFIPLHMLLILLLAAILREGIRGWRFFQSAIYMPSIIVGVLVPVVWRILLLDNGPINSWLRDSGLEWMALNWLGNPGISIITLGVKLVVLNGIGIGTVYFVASMSAVDKDLYDAAKIDGAGWWSTFFRVTIPGISLAVQFWLVLQVIKVVARLFQGIFFFTKGGPGVSTWTLEFGIYQLGFQDSLMGYGSAWAIILFIICAVASILQIMQLRRQGEF